MIDAEGTRAGIDVTPYLCDVHVCDQGRIDEPSSAQVERLGWFIAAEMPDGGGLVRSTDAVDIAIRLLAAWCPIVEAARDWANHPGDLNRQIALSVTVDAIASLRTGDGGTADVHPVELGECCRRDGRPPLEVADA